MGNKIVTIMPQCKDNQEQDLLLVLAGIFTTYIKSWWYVLNVSADRHLYGHLIFEGNYSLTCANMIAPGDVFNLPPVPFKDTTPPYHTQMSANIIFMDCDTKQL